MDRRIIKPGTYDFVLALATIVILTALSTVSIYGTIESWMNSVQNPNWTSSWFYVDYLNRMNSYAYPFAVALVLVLCMCIPKRFVPRSQLLQMSLILLSLSVVVGVAWGLAAALGFILAVSAIVQLAVVVMVLARSKSLVFEREGVVVQLGSALLHLGFVVFAIDLVIIKDIQSHLGVFWFSTVLITLGTILSFYPREIASVLKGMSSRQDSETKAIGSIDYEGLNETPAISEMASEGAKIHGDKD